MSACSPRPSSSGLPPYSFSSSSSCPLGQDPAAPTDFSRLNPLVRISSTSKGSFSRIDSLASQFSFRGGKGRGDSELEELISLRLILAGKTKSPIGVVDLRGWLANRKSRARREGDEEAGWLGDGEERRRREDEGALEFLVAFERYRTDFFALDLEDQLLSPTPFQLISLLSLSSHNKLSTNNTSLPPQPPLKTPASFRLPVTPTSSAGASSNPSTPQSAFSSSSSPSAKQPQPMVYDLPLVARSRSGSAPPPLTLVPEGFPLPLPLAPKLPTFPSAASLPDATSSDVRSVRSAASSRRTAGGLRGMGQRPLPRPHEEEESEEEDYDEDEPGNRSQSRTGSKASSSRPPTRMRGMSGTSSSSSSNAGTMNRPSQPPHPTLSPGSRPRAATLPSSNASSSSSTNPFQDPLTSTLTTVPLSPLPPSPLSSVPPTPPPHDYDNQEESTQPLREELNVLLSLAERLPKEFRVTDQMRREAIMTTHPDVLSGLAGKVEEWAEKEWLAGKGGFLEDALENLDHRTAVSSLSLDSPLFSSCVALLIRISYFVYSSDDCSAVRFSPSSPSSPSSSSSSIQARSGPTGKQSRDPGD
ncbi:hypothetical protein BDY24DRAFT_156157 [Mrakia frigida]|uniref:uncharacterized protein n=1 Tax=Mrakia frigida TaxID=29902 RepID=UPI003FCBF4FA